MENKTGKYLKYAIGEIVLVVIGILIALSINNWNQDRKNSKTIILLYKNLQANLLTDSVALADIILKSNTSISNMEIVLTTPTEKLLSKSNSELTNITRGVYQGVYSFYPKMGVYNQIVSSNLMDLIKSDELKNALQLYYDYRSTRYRSLDPVMDKKYHEYFQAFMADELEMVFFDNLDDQMPIPKFTETNVNKLKAETRKIYDLSLAVDALLATLNQDINNLLIIINKELEHD